MGVLIQRQGQIPIALGGDHAGGGVLVKGLADHQPETAGPYVVVLAVPYAVGITCPIPRRPIDRYTGNGGQIAFRTALKGELEIVTEAGFHLIAGGRLELLALLRLGGRLRLRLRLRLLSRAQLCRIAASALRQGDGNIGIARRLDHHRRRAGGKGLGQLERILPAIGAGDRSRIPVFFPIVKGGGRIRLLISRPIHRYRLNGIEPVLFILCKLHCNQLRRKSAGHLTLRRRIRSRVCSKGRHRRHG